MWTCKFFKMKKKFYKKLKKWKRYLLKYLEKKSVGNCKTFLSFTQVPQKVQRKRWKMKWKMHAMESQQRWNLFWNYLIHLAQPISTRCSQFTLWKTLSRGYKRWTPSTNGLKETILGVIISDERWNYSSYSLFSDFQYHLILSITTF